MKTEETTEKVFKALADSNRRMMLDLVKDQAGITVSELAAHFPFTRYAVMKHLRTLEGAQLIVSRRAGRTKQLYINAVPIQSITDRWMSRYSRVWAARLTGMKYTLERENQPLSNYNLRQVYVIYIQAPAERVWDAITQPEHTRQYYYGGAITSDLQIGSPFDYFDTNNEGEPRLLLTGKVVEVKPFNRLVHTFAFPYYEDRPSRVTYEIEEQGDVVKLTVTHQFEEESQTSKETSEGWPLILSKLKTWLETGKRLEAWGLGLGTGD